MAGDSFVARLCTLSISDMSFLNLGVQAVLPYGGGGGGGERGYLDI